MKEKQEEKKRETITDKKRETKKNRKLYKEIKNENSKKKSDMI